MPDVSYVVCSPTYLPAHVLSVTMRCSKCGMEVWVSLTMAPLCQQGALPICIDCGREVPSNGRSFAIHPSQVQELQSWGILEWSTRFVADLNQGRRW